jgi:hypothetical protein
VNNAWPRRFTSSARQHYGNSLHFTIFLLLSAAAIASFFSLTLAAGCKSANTNSALPTPLIAECESSEQAAFIC